jgi:hypothetical protein
LGAGRIADSEQSRVYREALKISDFEDFDWLPAIQIQTLKPVYREKLKDLDFEDYSKASNFKGELTGFL